MFILSKQYQEEIQNITDEKLLSPLRNLIQVYLNNVRQNFKNREKKSNSLKKINKSQQQTTGQQNKN